MTSDPPPAGSGRRPAQGYETAVANSRVQHEGAMDPGRTTSPGTAESLPDRYAAARVYLRQADPVLGELIDEHPDFDPRRWMEQLPKMDAFGALLFQVVGQQLSVSSTRAILGRVEALFGGRLPEPQELLDTDPEAVRGTGLSRRKVETLRTLAERFVVDGLGEETFLQSSDAAIEATLTAIPGIGPWTVRGFLMIALDRPDVFPSGDLALRRAARRLYGFSGLPTEQELQAIAERWRPYRSLAAGYLFLSEFDAKPAS
jgi:DNA-3-methyladenine glycosylase II